MTITSDEQTPDFPHPTLHAADLKRGNTKTNAQNLAQRGVYYTYNARAAIYQICKSLSFEKGTKILVPSFHCPSVVEAILRAGYQIVFYRITKNLRIDHGDLEAKLSKDIAAVVVINYFGFPVELGNLDHLKHKFDFYVIEDCAHSFLDGKSANLTGDRGDFAVYSFYKIVPTYVGGGLRINVPDYAFPVAHESVTALSNVIIFKRMFEQLIRNSRRNSIKAVYDRLERCRIAWSTDKRIAALGGRFDAAREATTFDDRLANTAMPWLAKKVLYYSNFKELVARRKLNYNILAHRLNESAAIEKIFPCLPDSVCPWAFPILVRNRGDSDHVLRRLGVPLFTFGEQLHPLVHRNDSILLEDAEFLSNNILLVSIHQYLDPEKMRRTADILNAHFVE